MAHLDLLDSRSALARQSCGRHLNRRRLHGLQTSRMALGGPARRHPGCPGLSLSLTPSLSLSISPRVASTGQTRRHGGTVAGSSWTPYLMCYCCYSRCASCSPSTVVQVQASSDGQAESFSPEGGDTRAD